ncbi:hypothetical protein T4D_5265 [Trichinella pseudospiralis]|uniref:Uncharacterized protein n=1 Tax=Trichinella pseudospiralis TaxID=6337 RepID=A0A0V1DQM7_TRIPS|nr:hypothetical protein T4D_5265 [Trichinella pseudospiralis]
MSSVHPAFQTDPEEVMENCHPDPLRLGVWLWLFYKL